MANITTNAISKKRNSMFGCVATANEVTNKPSVNPNKGRMSFRSRYGSVHSATGRLVHAGQ